MKLKKMTVILACAVASGCAAPSNQVPALADGLYVMEANIRKPGVDRNYGGVDECTVTTSNGAIRIAPVGVHSNAWYEGTIIQGHVSLSVHMENPDPMIKAMNLSQSWEGTVQPDGRVVGSMAAYAGTNRYMSGTWTLKKR